MYRISDEFRVCLRIYEYNLRNEPVWFSKLADSLKDDMCCATVSLCLDRLYDCCMIDWDWLSVDGKWTRCVKVDSDFEGFIKGLYQSSYNDSQDEVVGND